MDSVLNGLPNHIRVTGLDIPHTTPGRFPELSLQNKQPPARHLRVEVGNTAVNTGIDMEINDVANPQLSRRIPKSATKSRSETHFFICQPFLCYGGRPPTAALITIPRPRSKPASLIPSTSTARALL